MKITFTNKFEARYPQEKLDIIRSRIVCLALKWFVSRLGRNVYVRRGEKIRVNERKNYTARSFIICTNRLILLG
jgi:hypothetical protein